MLALKKGFWTLNGKKYSDLNNTEKKIFSLLFRYELNKNVLCNKN